MATFYIADINISVVSQICIDMPLALLSTLYNSVVEEVHGLSVVIRYVYWISIKRHDTGGMRHTPLVPSNSFLLGHANHRRMDICISNYLSIKLKYIEFWKSWFHISLKVETTRDGTIFPEWEKLINHFMI